MFRIEMGLTGALLTYNKCGAKISTVTTYCLMSRQATSAQLGKGSWRAQICNVSCMAAKGRFAATRSLRRCAAPPVKPLVKSPHIHPRATMWLYAPKTPIKRTCRSSRVANSHAAARSALLLKPLRQIQTHSPTGTSPKTPIKTQG